MNPILLTGFWAVFYQALLVLALIGSWVFPIAYAIQGFWVHTEMGRHVMSFSVTIAIAMTLLCLRPFFGPGPVQSTVVGMVLIACIGFNGWWRASILYRVQRKGENGSHHGLSR